MKPTHNGDSDGFGWKTAVYRVINAKKYIASGGTIISC